MRPPERAAISTRSTGAWVTYDLANTIFALGVVSLYFPDYMLSLGQPDGYLALVVAVAGILVIFLAPWAGAHSDARGRRLPTLRVTTLVAVTATAGLAVSGALFSFILLGVALVGFNVGSVVYDAMLPDVSTSVTQGRISGLGIGVGYFGSFIGLGIGVLTLEILGWSYAATFRALAAGFLLFSLPAFFMIVEPHRPPRRAPAMRTVISRLAVSWRLATTFPDVVRFLIGRFLYTDAINTLIGGFLTLYVIDELGFNRNEMTGLLAVAIATAVVGGIGAGPFIDRWGPKRVLRSVLGVWALGLVLVISAALTETLFLAWAIGPLGGAALGATWASDRVLMSRVSPPLHLGEFYGLYATVGRFATIVGPLVWGLIVNVLGWGRNAAMGALILFVVGGWIVVGGVDDGPRTWPDNLRDVNENRASPPS